MFRMIAAPVLLAPLLVAVDRVPTFDVTPSCRAATQRAVPVGDVSVCIRKEQDAREQIARRWSEFSQADKQTCVPLSTVGGQPTYTELLTCLDMAREARLARRKEQSSTTGQRTR